MTIPVKLWRRRRSNKRRNKRRNKRKKNSKIVYQESRIFIITPAHVLPSEIPQKV